jgi:malate dehydrogenase (oxaloacetate-decarboxylating)(NADP+)
MQRLGGAETIGPILAGLARPIHIVSPTSDDNEIIHIASIAAVEAQERDQPSAPAPAGAETLHEEV